MVKSCKQRRTLKQMFLDLRGLGYEGSYDRVAGFGRQWKVGQMEGAILQANQQATVHLTLLRMFGEPTFPFSRIDIEEWLDEADTQ